MAKPGSNRTHANRFRLRPGEKLDLRRRDPADSGPFKDRQPAIARLDAALERLHELQDKLYSHDRPAGSASSRRWTPPEKTGMIEHVMCGRQSPRAHRSSHSRLPRTRTSITIFSGAPRGRPRRAGRIGIFNRSHYEDVLIVRVHPEFLASAQPLPPAAMDDKICGEALPRDQRLPSGTWTTTASGSS